MIHAIHDLSQRDKLEIGGGSLIKANQRVWHVGALLLVKEKAPERENMVIAGYPVNLVRASMIYFHAYCWSQIEDGKLTVEESVGSIDYSQPTV
jgi:hypothetical protein